MSDFYPGQEVVCVDDTEHGLGFRQRGETWPVRGQHYTIRYTEPDEYGAGLFVYLVEIINPALRYLDGYGECSFDCNRFRPIKSEAIEIFRQMCVTKKIDA